MATTQIKNGFNGGSDDQLLVNPDGSINVNSSGGGGNASVGTTGTTAPTSATEIAGVDPSGNLKGVSVDVNGFLNVSGTSVVSGNVTTTEAGLTTFQTSQYTVNVAEQQLTPTPLSNRSSISLKVQTTDATQGVYISPTAGNVAATGYLLFGGESLQMDLTPSGNIYVAATANGQRVYVLEIA